MQSSISIALLLLIIATVTFSSSPSSSLVSAACYNPTTSTSWVNTHCLDASGSAVNLYGSDFVNQALVASGSASTNDRTANGLVGVLRSWGWTNKTYTGTCTNGDVIYYQQGLCTDFASSSQVGICTANFRNTWAPSRCGATLSWSTCIPQVYSPPVCTTTTTKTSTTTSSTTTTTTTKPTTTTTKTSTTTTTTKPSTTTTTTTKTSTTSSTTTTKPSTTTTTTTMKPSTSTTTPKPTTTVAPTTTLAPTTAKPTTTVAPPPPPATTAASPPSPSGTTAFTTTKPAAVCAAPSITATNQAAIEIAAPLITLPADWMNQPNVARVKRIINESYFTYLFPYANKGKGPQQGNGPYTYNAFLQAVARFPHFCDDAAVAGTPSAALMPDKDTVCKVELSTMFAHFAQESGRGCSSCAYPRYRQALYYYEEVACVAATPPASCAYTQTTGWPATYFPGVSGQRYYGRGPFQLTWNYHYGWLSSIFYGSSAPLLKNPGLVVSTDPTYSWLAIASGMWFYMNPGYPKPSMHNIVTGQWVPTAADITAGRPQQGFAATCFIINGGECGGGKTAAINNRISFYDGWCAELGVTNACAYGPSSCVASSINFAASTSSPAMYWNPGTTTSCSCTLGKSQTAFLASTSPISDGYTQCVASISSTCASSCGSRGTVAPSSSSSAAATTSAPTATTAKPATTTAAPTTTTTIKPTTTTTKTPPPPATTTTSTTVCSPSSSTTSTAMKKSDADALCTATSGSTVNKFGPDFVNELLVKAGQTSTGVRGTVELITALEGRGWTKRKYSVTKSCPDGSVLYYPQGLCDSYASSGNVGVCFSNTRYQWSPSRCASSATWTAGAVCDPYVLTMPATAPAASSGPTCAPTSTTAKASSAPSPSSPVATTAKPTTTTTAAAGVCYDHALAKVALLDLSSQVSGGVEYDKWCTDFTEGVMVAGGLKATKERRAKEQAQILRSRGWVSTKWSGTATDFSVLFYAMGSCSSFSSNNHVAMVYKNQRFQWNLSRRYGAVSWADCVPEVLTWPGCVRNFGGETSAPPVTAAAPFAVATSVTYTATVESPVLAASNLQSETLQAAVVADVSRLFDVPASSVQVQLSTGAPSSSGLSPSSTSSDVTFQITINNIMNSTEQALVDATFDFGLNLNDNVTWLASTKQVLQAESPANTVVDFSLKAAEEVYAPTTSAVPAGGSNNGAAAAESSNPSGFNGWCTSNSPRCLGIFLGGALAVFAVVALVLIRRRRQQARNGYNARRGEVGDFSMMMSTTGGSGSGAYSQYEYAADPGMNNNNASTTTRHHQNNQQHHQFQFNNTRGDDIDVEAELEYMNDHQGSGENNYNNSKQHTYDF